MKAGFVDSVVLLAYVDEPFWAFVRGYRHPEGYVIVEPYKRLNCAPPPPTPREPIPCIGSGFHIVPRDRVLIHEPSEALALLDWEAREKIEELASKIDAAYYGITGSRAIACAGPGSDYDIIVYGVPGDVGDRLERLRAKGVISQCKWASIASKRKPRHPRDVAVDPVRVRSSLLDSCYKGLPYTLRIIERINEEACGEPIAVVGVYEGPARILEAIDAYSVPARYLVELEGVGEAILETWRTRYQELAPGRYLVRATLRIEGERQVATPDHGGYIAWP